MRYSLLLRMFVLLTTFEAINTWKFRFIFLRILRIEWFIMARQLKLFTFFVGENKLLMLIFHRFYIGIIFTKLKTFSIKYPHILYANYKFIFLVSLCFYFILSFVRSWRILYFWNIILYENKIYILQIDKH